MKKLMFCLMASLFIMSCGDDDSAPVLTITSDNPFNVLATATEGGTVQVTGTATDDLGITSVAMSSENLAEDVTFLPADLNNDAFGLDLDIPAGTPASSFELSVVATDTGNNTTEEIVTVNITN